MVGNLPSIHSIVLTTDLSTDSASAYSLAASLTQMYSCSLTILTCIDTSPQYSEASLGTLEAPAIIAPQSLTNAYADVENALRETLAEYFDTTRTNYYILQAPVPVRHSIVTYLDEKKPDLVIMSSHGRSGISRALLGSVTEHVLRHCGRPVLVVPAKPR